MGFSVIVPVYNSEDTIKQCIDSLVNQTFDDYEIIIVDDGSSDKTYSIIKNYTQNNIKIIKQNNQGHTAARCKGLEYAEKEYILFVDSDDWCEISMLEKCHKQITDYNSDIVIFSYKEIFSDRENIVSLKKYEGCHYANSKDSFTEALIMTSKGECIPRALWGKAFRRELVEKKQYSIPKEIITGEDMCCFLSVVMDVKTVSVIDEPLYNYRILESSVSRKPDKKALARCKVTVDFLNGIVSEDNTYYREQLNRLIVFQIYSALVRAISAKKTIREAKRELREICKTDVCKNSLKNADFSKRNCILKYWIVKYRAVRIAKLINRKKCFS